MRLPFRLERMTKMRNASVKRETKETKVDLKLKIDGEGDSEINTGVGFFDHMLTLTAKHGLLELNINCNGDIEVDQHHSVEDVGIAFGQAVNEALGNKEGINRYATVSTPMDEA